MTKYFINKVKTWDGVKYAVQKYFTHYPIQYDEKGNMITEKRDVKGGRTGVKSIDVPVRKEVVELAIVEYRQKVKKGKGKPVYRTVPALFDNTSAGLEEAKRVRDMLIEKDQKDAEKEAAKASKASNS